MQKAQITNNHRMLIEFWLKFTNILWPSQDWFLKTLGFQAGCFFFFQKISKIIMQVTLNKKQAFLILV